MEVEELLLLPFLFFMAFLSLHWFRDDPVSFVSASSFVFRFSLRRLAGVNI
jgi:hypothetical protein